MSYNIRNIEGGYSLFNDPLTFEYTNRNLYVLNAIKDQMPDILGLQEVNIEEHAHANNPLRTGGGPTSMSWFDTLEGSNGLLANGYSVFRGDPAGSAYNPIYYKASKVTFISGDTLNITATGGKARIANWASFQTINGGQTFIVVNVHFKAGHTDDDKAERAENATKLMAWIEEVKLLGYPIILLGDFNANINDAAITSNITNASGGFSDTKVDATVKVNASSSTGLNPDAYTTLYGSFKVDHIFTTLLPEYTRIPYYETVDNKYITGSVGKYPSDHLPVIAYIEFAIIH